MRILSRSILQKTERQSRFRTEQRFGFSGQVICKMTNELIEQMLQNIQKVDDVANNVAAISEEQAASADEILETSHHMVEQANSITQSSQDVADNSHELANTSDTLTSYVQQFKI